MSKLFELSRSGLPIRSLNPTGLAKEDDLLSQLEGAREVFKKLLNISTASDHELLGAMHLAPKERKVWDAYRNFERAHRIYGEHLPGPTNGSSYQIIQLVRNLFQAIRSYFYTEAERRRYGGRAAYLKEKESFHQETVKAVEVFSKYFKVKRKKLTLEEIDNLFRYVSQLQPKNRYNLNLAHFNLNKELYLAELNEANLDRLLRKPIFPPEIAMPALPPPEIDSSDESDDEWFDATDEGYDRLVQPSPSSMKEVEQPSSSKILKITDPEEIKQLMFNMIHGALQDEEMARIIAEKVFPISEVESIQMQEDSTCRITFKSPMSGTAKTVNAGGWDDMRQSRLVTNKHLDILVDPANLAIHFANNTHLSMGIYIGDFSFLLDKIDDTVERAVLSTALFTAGYKGIWNDTPLQFSVNITGMGKSEGKLDLMVKLVDDEVPLRQKGKKPEGAFKKMMQSQLDIISLTQEEVAPTFANFSWEQRS